MSERERLSGFNTGLVLKPAGRWSVEEVAGMRWARERGHTLSAIGHGYGISGSRVRQLLIDDDRESKKVVCQFAGKPLCEVMLQRAASSLSDGSFPR